MKRPANIPRIPHAFFRWYCKKDRYEELHGDLEEFYEERLATMGSVKARLYYLRDVIRCCQPYAWKTPRFYTNSNVIMFKNYFKTSLRSMRRHALSSFINIFGLAVATGVSIVVYSMINFSYSVDRYHDNKDKVFLSTFTSDIEGQSQRYGMSPTPLGKMMKEDLAQLTHMSRVDDHGVVIKHEDNVFQEVVRFADADFLEMLTFPLKWGDKSSLADRNAIILSEAMAIKYFGHNEPLGEEMLVKFSEDRKKTFTVQGVAEAFEDARAIEFDFLINFENIAFASPDYDENNWSSFIDGLLIQVVNPEDIGSVAQAMGKYKELQNAKEIDWKIEAFGFESIHDLHINSKYIAYDISRDLADEILIGLPVMGALILALACFNYMNMSIGASTRRLKEIGVRKVIGANRQKVLIQFLAENVFTTLFALALGLFLSATLFLPWFGAISDTRLSLGLMNFDLWGFLIIMVLVTGIVSGFYPSLYVSGFQVVHIFKGTVRFGKKSPVMKVFFGLQMVLAFVFMTMAVMFHLNSDYQSQRSWGYDQEGTLFVDAVDRSGFDKLQAAMEQYPEILRTAGSEGHMGKSAWKRRIKVADKPYEVQGLSVGAGYFETFGLKLSQGQFFKPQSDKARELVVNERFVENAGLETPVGQLVTLDSIQYLIVGVVEDFHMYNFFARIEPLIFVPSAAEDFRFLTMRVREGSELAVFDHLRKQWADLFPETPFQGGLQIDLWADFYLSLDKMKAFTRTVALVAVLLAALGLYGLVSLNVSGRMKEFSIRKVLGARLKNITTGISKQYIVLLGFALVLGAPVAYLLNIGLMTMMFPEPMPHGEWGVGFAFVLLFAVMFAVMCTQIRRVLRFNPANGLRTE